MAGVVFEPQLATVRCGVKPKEVGFRPRFAGVDGIWKDFRSGDGALSSSGASERRLLLIGWPESSSGVPGSRCCTTNQQYINVNG